jgi:hypothetical protein
MRLASSNSMRNSKNDADLMMMMILMDYYLFVFFVVYFLFLIKILVIRSTPKV